MDFEQADAINQAIRLLSLRHRARAAALLAPLGLHPGQEVLLLELARTGPMIQAQLSEALGSEPPSVTLMTRKLEASGHIRRKPAPSDKRASIVELTDSGKALADQVKQLWCALAEETVTGLPAETVAELPGVLKTLTATSTPGAPAARTAAGTARKGRAKKGGCAAPAGQRQVTGVSEIHPARQRSGQHAPAKHTGARTTPSTLPLEFVETPTSSVPARRPVWSARHWPLYPNPAR